MRTIILKGEALRLAIELDAFIRESEKAIQELLDQAKVVQVRGNERCLQFGQSIAKELGLSATSHCHVKRDLILEHGFAYVETACEDEEANPIAAMLEQMTKSVVN